MYNTSLYNWIGHSYTAVNWLLRILLFIFFRIYFLRHIHTYPDTSISPYMKQDSVTKTAWKTINTNKVMSIFLQHSRRYLLCRTCEWRIYHTSRHGVISYLPFAYWCFQSSKFELVTSLISVFHVKSVSFIFSKRFRSSGCSLSIKPSFNWVNRINRTLNGCPIKLWILLFLGE